MHMPPVPGSVPLTDTRLWLCFDLMLCVAFGANAAGGFVLQGAPEHAA